jgi:UMF1 family MFS transporter
VLTDHYGPKKTLVSVIALWICALGVVIANSSAIVYWMMGGVIGALMGATWTSARPLLVTLVPGEMLGEFFGLYALTGKAAAIIGPLIWGGVTIATEQFFSGSAVYKAPLRYWPG